MRVLSLYARIEFLTRVLTFVFVYLDLYLCI
jgi:hypothetical protein